MEEDSGTVLSSPVQMLPGNPKEMWSGRSPISVWGFKLGSKKIKILEPAPLNSLTIKVDNAADLKVGDRIRLSMTRKSEAAAPFVAPHGWSEKWTSGITIREFHEVKSINGNSLTLAEPIMIAVDDKNDWTLQDVSFISNIGFENLFFKGNWNEKFKHHRSWRDDSAWRGLAVTGAENSWIRNCTLESMNWAIQLASCRQMTVENLKFTGTPAHFGMQDTATYGILAIKVLDLAGHHHGPSLQSGSCATVYHQCLWREDGSFDSHANNPYATLHDCNQGGLDLNGVGGADNNFPHHLHGLVLWNLNLTGTSSIKTDFWSDGKSAYGSSFTQVIIAGLHGKDQPLQDDSIFRNESPGQAVMPRSLWLAQLERRLVKIPSHFQYLMEGASKN